MQGCERIEDNINIVIIKNGKSKVYCGAFENNPFKDAAWIFKVTNRFGNGHYEWDRFKMWRLI